MKIIVTVIALFFAGNALGQSNHPEYSGIIEGGITNGAAQGNGWLSTSHGIRNNNWFFGVGTGIDFYRFRSVPVFLVLHKQFGSASIRPIIYCAAGMNADWLNEDQKKNRVGWEPVVAAYDPGLFLRSGLGVVFNAKGRLRYTAGAAWSFKSVRERYQAIVWDPWPQPGNGMTQKTLVYKMNRLDIGFGILF